MHKKGFSLLELITVIAIIMIMTAVVLSSGLIQNRKERELEAAAREVAAAIREAQNNALTGKNADSDCNTYRFSFTDSSASYRVGNIAPCTNTPADYSLKNGVTFNGGGTIDFPIPFATPSITPPATFPVSIVVCKGGTDDSDCHKVCVNSAGKVEEIKGNALPVCPS